MGQCLSFCQSHNGKSYEEEVIDVVMTWSYWKFREDKSVLGFYYEQVNVYFSVTWRLKVMEHG